MRSLIVASLVLALALGSSAFADLRDTRVLPSEWVGLMPANMQQAIASQSMTFSTSSYTITNPAAGHVVAVLTPTTGETAYLLGTKVGGTVQGYFDAYTGSTRLYNSQFFGDYGDSGWVFHPNWETLTAAGGSPLSLRNPDQLTGTYNATILVGTVK